ncbi:MAG: ATP-binding protein [Anaerolineae bacterium]|jgi:signal transduction histidine kinase
MQDLDYRADETKADLKIAMRELSLATTKTSIQVLGLSYLVWHLAATGMWPTTLGFQIWPISLTILAASLFALRLLQRGYLDSAQGIWLLGLAVAILVAVVCLESPALLLAGVVIPFLAMIMAGWLYAVIAEVGIVIVGLVALSVLSGFSGSTVYIYATAIGGACALLIGWSSSQALMTVTQWSLDAMTKARRAAREAQERRAEWASLAKDLDKAYLRLQRNHAALISAWRTAHEAERAKSRFISTISHEIRTPLNLIAGFSELMLTAPENYAAEPIPGPYRGDLNAICTSARYLLKLADDVLDVARSEEGKLTVVLQPADLGVIVGEVAAMISEYVSAKGLDLVVKVPDDLPEMMVDPLRIRQVLLNLLVNAARFTDSGSIAVGAAVEGEQVRVEVTDTGKGIPASDLAKVFEEYQTTASQTPLTNWQGGTGLGLPISKKLIERHGGQMGIVSTHMKGTTVWFTLPGHEDAQIQSKAPDYRLLRTRLPEASSRAHDRVVVAVHEDPRITATLQRHLDGFRIVGATTVDEGTRAAAETGAVALVVADDRSIEGISATVPVISMPVRSPREAAVALGADDLVGKPIVKADLLGALDRLDHPVKRALIVDDDPDCGRLVRSMLLDRLRWQDILEASTAQEALEIARAEKPDVIMLDLLMPGMDGYQMLRRLRTDPEISETHVVVVSSSADSLAADRKSTRLCIQAEGSDQRLTLALLRSMLEALGEAGPALLELSKGS